MLGPTPSGGCRGLGGAPRSSAVDIDHFDGVVPVAQAVPWRNVGLHVAGGVGRSGPQRVPADSDRVPGEAPVLPLVVAARRFDLGGLPVAFSGEADVHARDGPGSGPSLP